MFSTSAYVFVCSLAIVWGHEVDCVLSVEDDTSSLLQSSNLNRDVETVLSDSDLCRGYPSLVKGPFQTEDVNFDRPIGTTGPLDNEVTRVPNTFTFLKPHNEQGQADSYGKYVNFKQVYSDGGSFYGTCVWSSRTQLHCVDSEAGTYTDDFVVVAMDKSCSATKIDSWGRGIYKFKGKKYIGTWSRVLAH